MMKIDSIWLSNEFKFWFHFSVESILLLICKSFIKNNDDFFIITIFPLFEEIGNNSTSEECIKFVSTPERWMSFGLESPEPVDRYISHISNTFKYSIADDLLVF